MKSATNGHSSIRSVLVVLQAKRPHASRVPELTTGLVSLPRAPHMPTDAAESAP